MLSFYLAVIQDEKSKSKFENIYLTHHKAMLKIAFEITKNQHDAEDALSDALYRIARNIEKIDDTNEILLKSYLFKATKNSAIDILRRRSKELNLDEVFTLPSESDVIAEIIDDEECRMLVKSIYAMPYTYRDVLVLHFLHGLRVREIADSLSMNVSSVKTKIRRGKRILSRLLAEDKK